ncbi:MAG TPA: protease complex subunit PrcB family protein [Longimicrobium sp.]|nr:protease complex subunit PrcB family protein [Longimicrobium sp.]
MARIGIVGWAVAAGLLGCGDGVPKPESPRREAEKVASQAPPPPRAVTGYLFAPATLAEGDVPPVDYAHSCQPDAGGQVRDPVPLGPPLRSLGRPPVLYRDTVSLLPSPLRCVIQNQDDWTEVRILGSLRLPRDFAGIDFPRETVLIAGLGARPTAGYAVRFDSLAVRNDTLFAFVGRLSPAPGAVLTAGTVSPVEVLRIPKHRGPVVFVEETIPLPPELKPLGEQPERRDGKR